MFFFIIRLNRGGFDISLLQTIHVFLNDQITYLQDGVVLTFQDLSFLAVKILGHLVLLADLASSQDAYLVEAFPVEACLEEASLVTAFLVEACLVEAYLVAAFLVASFLVAFPVEAFPVEVFHVEAFLVGAFLVGASPVGASPVGASLVGVSPVEAFLVEASLGWEAPTDLSLEVVPFLEESLFAFLKPCLVAAHQMKKGDEAAFREEVQAAVALDLVA